MHKSQKAISPPFVLSNMKPIDQLQLIKTRLRFGIISYDTAKNLATPLLAQLNREASVVAKKYGKRHKNFTFTGFFR